MAWTRAGPAERLGPAVSVAAGGDTIVAWRDRVERLDGEGAPMWSSPLPPAALVDAVRAADDGRVVALGVFVGSFRWGEAALEWDGPGWIGFLASARPDGTPDSLAARALGPAAIAADGGVDLAAGGWKVSEVYPIPRWASCGQELLRLDADGAERARAPLASCPGEGRGDLWWASVAAGPSGDVWVLGDARRAVDAGSGLWAPRGRDVFLVRVSP